MKRDGKESCTIMSCAIMKGLEEDKGWNQLTNEFINDTKDGEYFRGLYFPIRNCWICVFVMLMNYTFEMKQKKESTMISIIIYRKSSDSRIYSSPRKSFLLLEEKKKKSRNG